MCGITGIISRIKITDNDISSVKESVFELSKRGPDANGIEIFENAVLGHTRLSIIDITSSANQPFQDKTGRYSLVFNGEIFNYLSLRKELQSEGINFKTNSDTEVILELYIKHGTSFLNKLNGFFAIAIFDNLEQNTLIARDRFGIKPLLFYKSEDQFLFSSEMKGLLKYNIPREIDHSSLFSYLQLNYIPEPHSIIQNIKKIEPGHYLKIDSENRIQKIPFYQLDYPKANYKYSSLSYDNAKTEFTNILDRSVERRLVSDVPLGTFLSGGIDSSLITALASRKVKNLNTFSIGFADEPLFDETEYALSVSKMYKTNHHVFSLTNNDLLDSLYDTLDYIDEPFADSSALAVNALSKRTQNHVKVALSGDGADELFAGYHKHMGEFLMRKNGPKQQFVKKLKPVWDILPKSRNSKLGNLFRKLNKFADGAALSTEERYWLWASLMNEADASNLLLKKAKPEIYRSRKSQHLSLLKNSKDFNDVLATDLNLVLQSDMLRKVDMMSMSHGLEVRTPFLDHEMVNFAFTIPANYKISNQMKKMIVQDAARDLLPSKLYNRPKQGFEVPLLNWFKSDLKGMIQDDLLSEKFIKTQKLFNPASVRELVLKVNSNNPQDSQANIWALLVFNHWWKKYIA